MERLNSDVWMVESVFPSVAENENNEFLTSTYLGQPRT